MTNSILFIIFVGFVISFGLEITSRRCGPFLATIATIAKTYAIVSIVFIGTFRLHQPVHLFVLTVLYYYWNDLFVRFPPGKNTKNETSL